MLPPPLRVSLTHFLAFTFCQRDSGHPFSSTLTRFPGRRAPLLRLGPRGKTHERTPSEVSPQTQGSSGQPGGRAAQSVLTGRLCVTRKNPRPSSNICPSASPRLSSGDMPLTLHSGSSSPSKAHPSSLLRPPRPAAATPSSPPGLGSHSAYYPWVFHVSCVLSKLPMGSDLICVTYR